MVISAFPKYVRAFYSTLVPVTAPVFLRMLILIGKMGAIVFTNNSMTKSLQEKWVLTVSTNLKLHKLDTESVTASLTPEL